MSNGNLGQQKPSDDHSSGFLDAAFAYLHVLYRKDIASLEVAIASATGKHRERLRVVLANVRSEQR